MHDYDAFGAFEKAGWGDGRSDPYLRGVGAITAFSIDPLLDLAGVAEGHHILDVATGTGEVAARAVERGATVAALDFSIDMLALAAQRHVEDEIVFEYGDVKKLPYPADTFDAVTGNFMMPHLTDLPRAVAECARVTRPGGKVALATWDSPERTRYLGAVIEAVDEAGVAPPEGLPPVPSLFQYSDDAEFSALLVDAGLSDPVVSTLSFTHHVPDLDVFWADLLTGTVRTIALMTSQPAQTQDRIRDAYDRILEPYRTPSGWDLPCSFKLGAGTKA